jgi:hypothetical protein
MMESADSADKPHTGLRNFMYNGGSSRRSHGIDLLYDDERESLHH